MDKILITSRMFSEYFQREFGFQNKKTEYLPQYAEGIFEQIPPRTEDGTFNFMFAGNIGAVQSVETIIKAAEDLKAEPVKFHIVGGGTDLERLQKMGENTKNVVFMDVDRLRKCLSLCKGRCNVDYASSRSGFELNSSWKGAVIYGCWKADYGAIDGETKTVIEEAQCGFCGRAEDVDELVENIRRFISDNTDRFLMGENAREFYVNNFRELMFMDKLEKYLNEGFND